MVPNDILRVCGFFNFSGSTEQKKALAERYTKHFFPQSTILKHKQENLLTFWLIEKRNQNWIQFYKTFEILYFDVFILPRFWTGGSFHTSFPNFWTIHNFHGDKCQKLMFFQRKYFFFLEIKFLLFLSLLIVSLLSSFSL